VASHTLQRRLASPARTAPVAGTDRPKRPGFRGFLPLLPLALFLLIALVGPSAGLDGNRQDLLDRLQPPVFAGGSWVHPLGTDSLGRDVLARVLDAARLSLAIGVLAGGLSALVGVPAGILSGFLDGVPDRAITALAEICLSIPTIVIGIVLTAVLGQSLPNLIVILVVSGWIAYSRVLRLRVRSLMHAEFVLAAHATGASRARVITRHVLPNVLPTVVVLMFQQVAALMIWEASLTYLGIGLAVQDISLGSLIREGQQHVLDAWWIALAPGLLIALGVVGFNLAADWLNVYLDPALGRKSFVRS
jgi:peptide/nickel transport system permease protein